MRYSAHALKKLIDRNFTKAEVEAVIATPIRGTYEPKARDRIENLGFAFDGRPMNIVTNRAKTVVITVTNE